MKGLNLAEEFEDAGISAGKPLASRPAGSKLLAAAKKGKIVVVVAKLDRLFWSVADAANVIDDFDERGIHLVSIREGFDIKAPPKDLCFFGLFKGRRAAYDRGFGFAEARRLVQATKSFVSRRSAMSPVATEQSPPRTRNPCRID